MKTKSWVLALALLMVALATVNCAPMKFTAAEKVNFAAAAGGQDATEMIRSLQPTLAVRAMGCMNCHANVAANIVTDFGFGDSYFFGGSEPGRWKSGSPYGDHGPSFNTMTIGAGQTAFVPKAELPATVAKDTGLSTVAEYLSHQFSVAEAVSTRSVKIKELGSLYIGAPTDSDLVDAFKLERAERVRYIPSLHSKLAFSGLEDKSTFFQASKPLVCDGDLVLRGPLLLDNAQIETDTGCRIYVLGSVFIFGTIELPSASNSRNVQITATRSIGMGLGLEKINGQHCEPGSNWARYPEQPSYEDASSLITRYVAMWTTQFSPVRGASDPVEFGKSIVAEAKKIEDVNGPFLDASCRPEKRSVSYERILLNAPIVHSRYTGSFKGTIITEYALMSLGMFTFEYDPVFGEVNVLPFLNRSLLLQSTE